MPDRYNPDRDITPQFMARVSEWIAASGEVFILLRYLRIAGRKDYAFCRTLAEFESLVNEAPIGTDIEVFRQPQLLLRGVVTEEFIVHAEMTLANSLEFMVVCLQREPNSVLSIDGRFDETELGLRDELQDLIGQEVAVGPCPEFNVEDNDDLTSASKGGIDGPR